MKNLLLILAPVALCLQWIGLRISGVPLHSSWQALLPGLAIFGAAFLLSWAAELAQFEIPQSLAIAFVALVAVLPEYAVDMYFAWTAGKNPVYTMYATANMTGGNRLLIGAGWVAVVFFYWLKTRQRVIALEPGQRLELFALLLATLYSFVIPFKKTLSWVDALFFLTLFAAYLVTAAQSHHVEPELEEGPVEWMAQLPKIWRRGVTIGLFGLAGITIYMAAAPFAEGLLAVGRHLKIEEFLLVQWLAPLASESPEFIVATLFALRKHPGAGLGTLVSSKVNQWTLLVGMLPLAYALSSGSMHPMPLDARQAEEILLTSAQSLFALLLISDLAFSLWDGAAICLLFLTQLFFTTATARMYYSGLYFLFGAVLLVTRPSLRTGLKQILNGWR